jgi:hypothetical protein
MNQTLSMAASLVLASMCVAQAAPPAQAKTERATATAQDAPAGARAIMGVEMEEVDEALAQQLGVDPDSVVLIYDVMPGYGAAKAGIKKHDVIKAIDGSSPVSTDTVRKLLAKKKPGDKVKVTYIRGRDTGEVEIELMAAKDNAAVAGVTAPAQADKPGWTPGTANAPRVSAPQLQRAGTEPSATPAPGGGWLWRAQDEEQLRSAVQRLREQLRISEQDVGRRARDMAKESSALAEKIVQMTRDKALTGLNDEKVKRLGDAAQELAERSREKLEVEMRDVLEKHRDTLDKSMRDLEKLLGKLPSSEAVRVAREYTARATQPGGGAGAKVEVRPGQPAAPAPLTPGQFYVGQGGTAPLAVIGDSGKAFKKVEERLEGVEDRLEKIEQMLEKLVGRAPAKSTK